MMIVNDIYVLRLVFIVAICFGFLAVQREIRNQIF